MTTDPRLAGGDIVGGSGDPHAANDHLLDTTNAVLLDAATFSAILGKSDGIEAAAILLEGRINKTDEKARILFLTNEDGLAGIVSEALALGYRVGTDFGERLRERVHALVEAGSV